MTSIRSPRPRGPFLIARYLLLMVATCALPSAARAEDSKAVRDALKWAADNNLPTRRVTVGPEIRRQERVLVAVTPDKFSAFLDTFNAKQGYGHFIYAGTSNRHVVAGFAPPTKNGQARDCYLWGRRNPDYVAYYCKHSTDGGLVIPVPLGSKRILNMIRWCTKSPQAAEYRGGNCMRWLPNAEVEPGVPFFYALGLRRSIDGPNMVSKMVHAANHEVEVVGVCVPDRPYFERASDIQLLGPPPKNGLVESVRPTEAEQRLQQELAARDAQCVPERVLEQAKQGPVTVQQAASLAGNQIYWATGSAMPTELLTHVRQRAVDGVGTKENYFMATFAGKANFERNIAEKFHSNLLFISASNREAAGDGSARYLRDSLYRHAERIRANQMRFDTVAVRVSSPDGKGFVSLGTTGDLTREAIRNALKNGGRVIGEENPNVPRVRGNRLHKSKLAAVYQSQEPLQALEGMLPLAVEQRIAKNVARLIPKRQGCTLQVGIGSSLMGLGDALKDKQNLRIWSEMGSDWAIPLLTGDQPAAPYGVFSFLHGSHELYRFADKNPRVMIKSQAIVNNPKVLARMPRLRAVNTALEVDLTGNVNAEQIQRRIISAPGGQPDFMAAAATQPEGRAIMALRSENKFGTSNIVLDLGGVVVTTPSNFVDHVVTEWGVTKQLRNQDARFRAYELIRVAHPRHRIVLSQRAIARGLLTEAQAQSIKDGLFSAVRKAPTEDRGALAHELRAAGALNDEQLAELLAMR